MTNEQLIEKFNPANGANVTPEDLEVLHGLTDEQIDLLADAYPNQPTRRSYLRLYDKNLPLEKQLYQLSTWQNLRNVRKFSSKKNLIAWDFINAGNKFNTARPAGNKTATSPRKVVVDLTATEAAAELTKAITSKRAAVKPESKVVKSAIKSAVNKGVGKDAPEDQQFDEGAD